jgi:hypothetical protein
VTLRLTSESALVWVTLLISAGALLSTLEWLFNWPCLRAGAPLGWPGRPGGSPVLDTFLSYPNILAVLVVRLCALLLLPAALWAQRGHEVVLGIVLMSQLLLNRRNPQAMDGADQMATQVFGALLLGNLPGTELAREACLWYIAAQSCLSYCTSGVAKVFSPRWRKGNAVFLAFNSQVLGNEAAARFLHPRPALVKALSWGAMMMECLFPLVLVLGYPAGLIFLAWGIAFHLANAFILGFNSFLWSFVATYPAILFCVASSGDLIGRLLCAGGYTQVWQL